MKKNTHERGIREILLAGVFLRILIIEMIRLVWSVLYRIISEDAGGLDLLWYALRIVFLVAVILGFMMVTLQRFLEKKIIRPLEAVAEANRQLDVTRPEEDNMEGIVPAGRGDVYYGLYSSFGTYCSNPERKYTFLIDEEGAIYKCGFGVWDYANVSEYQEGGFEARFKEFNQKFYKCFVGNCAACQRSYRRHHREDRAT